jgi:hypothetical protein
MSHSTTIDKLNQRIRHFEETETEPSLVELLNLIDMLQRAAHRLVNSDDEKIPQKPDKGADETYISDQFKHGKGGRRTKRHHGHKKRSNKRMSRRR